MARVPRANGAHHPARAPALSSRTDVARDAGARRVLARRAVRASPIVALLVLLAACGGEQTPQPRPGLLDHRPHHGGVVYAGPRQVLEAAAAPDGTVRVWLGDGWREPLPIDNLQGSVTLVAPDGTRTAGLRAEGDALVARAGPIAGDRVPALVELLRDGNVAIRATFVLPLHAGVPGAAGVPLEGCVPPGDDAGPPPRPRCVVHFVQGVWGVGATPAGDAAIVSVLETPTSSWRLPEGTLLAGFEAPPPIELHTDQAPHVDEPISITTSPDGRQALLALGERLVVNDVASGRFVRELPMPEGAPRSVVWSPDGASVLVTRFSGHALFVLAADTGAVRRTLPIGDEVTTTVALAADGARAAVGTELGPIVVLRLAGDASPVRLVEPTQPSDALGFAGDTVVAAGGEGILRVWDAASGALRAAVPVGAPVMRLAVARDGRRAVTADRSGTLRIHALPSGTVTTSIGWHRAQVRGMAWAGTMLVAGDADHQLALWDLPSD